MNWNGLIPAMVTPMKEGGAVDEAALAKYVKWLLPQGPVALAVNTDAGEGPLLLPEERLRVLEVVAGEVAGHVPVVCGLGGVSSGAALEFGKSAKARGAAAWLVFPHGAFRGARGEDPVIIEYHHRVAALGLPIIVFQLQPELGGAEYPLETLARLTEIPEVEAIKEATFDAFRYRTTAAFLRGLPRRIAILTGNDNFILESFLMDADGALIGFGAVATREQAEMIRAVKSRDFTGAFALYSRLNPLAQAVFAPPVRDYRARLKEVLRLQGIIPAGHVRPPLLPLSRAETDGIRNVLSAHAFPVK